MLPVLFEIHFENGIIHTNDVVKICYAALLNENANIEIRKPTAST